MMRLACVVAVLASFAAATSLPAGFPPTEYSVSGFFNMPYGNISAPIHVEYNSQVGSVRSFYNGLDYTIQNLKAGLNYDISVDNNKLACTTSKAPSGPASTGDIKASHETLWSAFPADLATDYTYEGQVPCPGNVQFKCDMWLNVYTVLGKTGTYKFYFIAGTATPYQFSWLGYDRLIGSHFDHYVFKYTNYQSGSASSSSFAPPSICKNTAASSDEVESGMSLAMATLLPTGNEQRFTKFADKHGKKYADRSEFKMRQRIFHENEALIARLNADPAVTHFSAMNHLGDLTEAERKMMRGYKRSDKKPSVPVKEHVMSQTSLPNFVDWREQGAVSPVKDQGICGSCWAFSSTEAIEGQHFLKKGGKMLEFSEQNLMDCSWPYGNDACGGGFQNLAFEYVVKNGGIATEDSYGPYLMQNDYCHFNASFVVNGAQLSGYHTLSGEPALKDAIATVGPISISIDASLKSFDFYQSGVYYDPACGSSLDDLDHAVLAVGYGTDPVGGDYWIVKNSWSVYYGEWGYVKMSTKGNNCGVATSPVYPDLA